jgi:predicted AAA+ superfamily ATPase
MVDGLFIQKNCDVYITGSNAYMLSGELATLLTGRFLELEMLPLSFREIYDHELLVETSPNVKKNESLGKFGTETYQKSRNIDSFGKFGFSNSQNFPKRELFAKFLLFGGIPEAKRLGNIDEFKAENFINGVFETILEKDIYSRRRVNNKPAFEKLLEFLMDSIGSEVSPSSISKAFKVDGMEVSHKTISEYLKYLIDSLLFYKVPRFDVKGKHLLQTLDKYYVVDPFFRVSVSNRDIDEDRGHLLENAVYLELKRRHYNKVLVGKVGPKEVDFVCIRFGGAKEYFQVAWSTDNPDTLRRELESLENIRDSNDKYLITMDQPFGENYNGIKKVNAIDWFLEGDK